MTNSTLFLSDLFFPQNIPADTPLLPTLWVNTLSQNWKWEYNRETYLGQQGCALCGYYWYVSIKTHLAVLILHYISLHRLHIFVGSTDKIRGLNIQMCSWSRTNGFRWSWNYECEYECECELWMWNCECAMILHLQWDWTSNLLNILSNYWSNAWLLETWS